MTLEGIAVRGSEWVMAYERTRDIELRVVGGSILTPEQAHRLARRLHWLARRIENRTSEEPPAPVKAGGEEAA